MPNLPTFYFLSFSQCIKNVCLRLRQRRLRLVNGHSATVLYSLAIGVNTAFWCWFGYTRLACVAGVERGRGLGGRGKGGGLGTEGEGRCSLPFSLPPPLFAPVTQSTEGLNKIVKIPYRTSVNSPKTLPRYKRNQKISFGLDGIFLLLFFYYYYFVVVVAFCILLQRF